MLYIAIPLVAAAIGYVTNWVAIRMLFRPHVEKRVLGVRIPFTPGVIPSRRVEMAERMGAAVAQHLVTQESVTDRIDTPEVRVQIESLVSGYLDDWLERDLGPIETLIPEGFRAEWREFLDRLHQYVRSELDRALHDPRAEGFLKGQLAARLEDAFEKPLGELIPEELFEEIPKRLGDWLARLSEDEEFARRVRAAIDEKLDALMQDDRPLKEYVPEGLRKTAYAKMEELMPLMLDRLVAVLEDEQLKKRLKIQLYELVDKLLSETFRENSLWDQFKFGLMEAFVISTDEIKLKIDRSVDEAAPRLAKLLKQEDVQLRVQRALISSIDAFLDKRISEFQIAPETLAELKERLTGAILGAARSPDLRGHLVGFVKRKLNAYRDRSLRELLPDWNSERLADRLGRPLAEWLRRPETIDALAEFIDERLRAWTERPIGRLKHHIPEEHLAKAKSWLSDQILEILKRETPKLVESIDVQKLVREKVNELSLPEVEGLILAITSRQLKAITWFGALLGFLIGLLQVALILARGGF
jgi:uncharacterized membrane protein YheB (UPF0754 family)